MNLTTNYSRPGSGWEFPDDELEVYGMKPMNEAEAKLQEQAEVHMRQFVRWALAEKHAAERVGR